jgi:hypothetical protein
MFLERFNNLFGRLRRVRIGTALCLAAVGLLVSTALLAALDYRWELSSGIRRSLLGLMVGVVAILLIRYVWMTLRSWSRPTTAAELEDRFPELGQRVRTTLQYGPAPIEAIQASGVAPALVRALAADTDERTQPLELDIVVPSRRFRVTIIALAVVATGLLFSYTLDWQWRTAVRRAVLNEVPYTTLTLEPGNASVVEGGQLSVRLKLEGRTDRKVVLMTRPAGSLREAPAAGTHNLPATSDADWNEETLEPTANRPESAVLLFETRIGRITEPLEYRVTATSSRGEIVAESSVFDIGVRYPLAIQSVEATVTPPQYTSLASKTFQDGSVTALRGSHAVFRVTLDRVPASAWLRLTPRSGKSGEPGAPETIDLQRDGVIVSAALPLHGDFDWSLVAASPDGTPLTDNAFRVRVHEDRPPQISFAEPADSLEVHTLAEILMQTRVTDDYGVKRSGIVFQINSDEEHTLLEEDFVSVAEAADELAETGRAMPRTRATLERLLPLEHFGLTQKDCVVYYAFAEDNFPDSPNRSETDLRFIDIRPFKTIYRMPDPAENEPGDGGPQRRIASLEELIRRQRYALNRSIRLQKLPERWADSELNTVDRLIEYETELAQAARELAQFLESRGSDVADVLFQAEAAMLAAVDSLSIGQNETAVLQEKDAQQRLVEARDKLEVQITLNRELAAALRAIDQRLVQKIRRSRNEEEERRKERIVQRLAQLAMNEAGVAQALASMPEGGSSGREPTAEDAKPASESALEELQDKQAELAVEAIDLMNILQSLEGATDLAKERMKTAAEMVNTASADLNRHDMTAARAGARNAAELLREVARHVAGLMAGETSQQVAAARDVAADLTFRERKFAHELESSVSEAVARGPQRYRPSHVKAPQMAEPGDDPPADEARRLLESTRTLQDLMKAIADTKNSTSAEAVDRVTEVLSRGEIKMAVERFERLPAMLGEAKPPEQAVLDLREAADRMEATARELDRLYRSIVAPRIEQLRELEQRAAQLQQQMLQLESVPDVRKWERGAGELAERLEQEGVGGDAREQIQQLLGGGDDKTGLWTRWTIGADGFLMPGPRYVTNLQLLVETIQHHIQELHLADLQTAGDEATPPAYRQLVERYLQVLATEAKSR